VLEKFLGGCAKGRVVPELPLDHVPQRVEHGGQIGFELRHSLAELGDLGALMGEEQLQESLELGRVVDAAADHLLPVLDENGLARVLEDDVVLRIAATELALDLLVEIVLFVLRLPIAERHAQLVQQRSVDNAPLLCRSLDLVLRHEDQIARAAPALEQVLERFAHHRLSGGARDPA